MTIGFESIGDAGTVQIDANFKNYSLASSGTLTLSPTGAVGGLSTATLTVTGTAPLVAFNRLRVHIHKVVKSGSTWTYTFLGLTTPALPDPAQFNYYVFDVGYSSSGNVGLQLFDSAGAVTFDSSQMQFPNVVGTHSESALGSDVTLTFASGTDIAVIQAQMGYEIKAISGGGIEYYIILPQASGNSVLLDKRLWYTGTNSSIDSKFSPFYTGMESKFLFVDLSTL